jgi:hypothetical protein
MGGKEVDSTWLGTGTRTGSRYYIIIRPKTSSASSLYRATHNNGFRKEIRGKSEGWTEVITHTDELEDGEEDSRRRRHRG